jgi:hypothetical protein
MARRDRFRALVLSMCLGLAPGCTQAFSNGAAQPMQSMVMTSAEVPPPEPVPGSIVAVGFRSPVTMAITAPPAPDGSTGSQAKSEAPIPVVLLGPPAEAEPAPAPPPTAVAAKPVEEPALLAALRCFLEKRPEQALGRLRKYDEANQELLLRLLPLAARLTDNETGGNRQEMAVLLDELDGLEEPLRGRAALTIPNICFCRRIETFGVYEPLSPDHRFQPGDLVEVYVELRNFTSRKRQGPGGQATYVIDLASSAQVRDEAGTKVLPNDIVFQRKHPDESRTLRHDYFEKYRFYVPDLPPGAYTLWIQVEDRGTDPPRQARRSLDFRVTKLPVRGS